MHQHNSFSYERAEFEEVPCDLCGGVAFDTLGVAKERRARAVICRRCGLIFVSPRMTKHWYDRFYQEEYRTHGGAPVNMDAIFEGARVHGRALAQELGPYFLKKGLLVDVGSSVGGVLFGIKEMLGIDVMGIEPSHSEASYARSCGIPTHVSLIEDIEKKNAVIPLADQIICTQSLNHFLSPRFFFEWAWRYLTPGGRLILEVKNFRQQARRAGRVESPVQIDHAYMFVPETLREYLRAAGFRIIAFKDDEGFSLSRVRRRQKSGLPSWQMRVVAEKTGEPSFGDIAGAIDERAYDRILTSLGKRRLVLNHVFCYSDLSELFSWARISGFILKHFKQN